MSSQLATFRLAGDLFGVPVSDVQEVLMEQPHTPTPQAPAAVAGLINLRGQVVTALDLRVRLSLPPREPGSDYINVVVRHGEDVWSLLVDRIGDVIAVDDAQFEPPPDTLHGPASELILGAYKLEAELLLLLDVRKVLELSPAVAA